ncbi:hypothetical protein [Streptomyces sp. NPDC006333]|uniref:zinc finger domain-containing protein n=1 Tax=Streptomyces sp. NPDC006333 TaxID=3156753 RepID=UPI0033A87FB0
MTTHTTERAAGASPLPGLGVACTFCGAQPGALCTSHGGTRVRRNDVHRDRTRAAAFAQQSAEGDEPIPFELTDQAAEQPRRILTEDEYKTAYQAARDGLGAKAYQLGSVTVQDALDAALATVGILAPAPAADPETCSAMFADPKGGWHQCAQDTDHDRAEGHDSGEWSWPHDNVQQDAEAQQ